MPLIALVARCPFVHQGRSLRTDERFDASPIDAVVLVTARKATFAKPLPLPALKKKRTYKRRDMTADS